MEKFTLVRHAGLGLGEVEASKAKAMRLASLSLELEDAALVVFGCCTLPVSEGGCGYTAHWIRTSQLEEQP